MRGRPTETSSPAPSPERRAEDLGFAHPINFHLPTKAGNVEVDLSDRHPAVARFVDARSLVTSDYHANRNTLIEHRPQRRCEQVLDTSPVRSDPLAHQGDAEGHFTHGETLLIEGVPLAVRVSLVREVARLLAAA